MRVFYQKSIQARKPRKPVNGIAGLKPTIGAALWLLDEDPPLVVEEPLVSGLATL